MDTLVSWFVGFVDRVIRSDFSHCSWSPVKDLGTPKARPSGTIERRYPAAATVRPHAALVATISLIATIAAATVTTPLPVD